MTLLRVKNLDVAFGARRVVQGVSFTLDRGETLALVGESGSGKSLSALSLLQLLPSGGENPQGSVLLDNVEMVGASDDTLRQMRGGVAGMVFQEPMTSLNPLHRIGQQVEEAVQLHQSVTRTAARARAIESLQLAGFADAADRLDAYPHQLSGGQRQRVMIAMALANNPKLLIADEPTTALDVTIQVQILELLADLRTRLGMAMLLITHDLSIVRRYADKVCVMKNGEVVEAGSVAEVFADPQHAYTKMLLATEPRGAPDPVPDDATPLLQADDVRVWFPIKRGILRRTVAHVKAVDGVSVALREGETLGLVGESGSGKSTLAYALLRLEQSTGNIRFEDTKISAIAGGALRDMRARMQIVFQDPFGSLSPRMSVGDIMGEGLEVHQPGLTRAQRMQQVAQTMEEVGLDPATMDRYPHEFSGGQRQRIAIARAMVLKPRFVVLDEPTSALDVSVQAQIIDLLRGLQKKHRLAYLFISHDLKVVRAMSHRIMVLRRGKLIEEGEAAQILHAPREDYTRGLMSAAFALHESAS